MIERSEQITSAAYGFRTNKNLALAFVDFEASSEIQAASASSFSASSILLKSFRTRLTTLEGKRMRQ